MSKDPAIMFYTSDFLTGTLFMTDEQVGIYVRLLCAQHQHGGLIDKVSFNSMVKDHEIVKQKFIETDDGRHFFNERMMEEISKRNQKSNNLSKNASIRWEKYKQTKSNSTAIAQQLDVIEEKDGILVDEVINFLNFTANLSFKTSSKKTRALIQARFKEKFTVDDLKSVITFKVAQWINDPNMNQYIRPQTLFGTKFESYLQNTKSPKLTEKTDDKSTSAYEEAEKQLGLSHE